MTTTRLGALLLILALPATVWAGVDRPLLLTISLHKNQFDVMPAGDQTRAFRLDPKDARTTGDSWQVGSRLSAARDTLYLEGAAYPSERLGRLEVVRDDGDLSIRLFDRGADAPKPRRRNNRTGTAENLLIAAGEFVRGYVLSFGGDVRVAGEVNRSVVALGGDVFVEQGGVVRGSIIALGGQVHTSDGATVYGDLYTSGRRRLRPRWFDGEGQNELVVNPALDYNRVTGALPWFQLRVGPRSGPAPQFVGEVGYAFESELWHYRLGLERRDDYGPRYYVGAYRDTKNDDRFRIDDHENLVFALLFRTDYRDYYFAEGLKTELGWGFGPGRSVTFGYHNELLRPLGAHPRLWSLFGGDLFDQNYALLHAASDPRLATDFTGRLAFFTTAFDYAYPLLQDRRSGRWQVAVEAEGSHPDLSSDFNYSRYQARLIRSQPLWRDHTVWLRAAVGGAGGTLPALRLFYLGGLGSLRGYDYKSMAGDRFWLANAEYAWSKGGWGLLTLLDAGQIGYGDDWTDSRVRFSVGVGVSIQQSFRIQLAWAAAEKDRDPLVTFRFSRPF